MTTNDDNTETLDQTNLPENEVTVKPLKRRNPFRVQQLKDEKKRRSKREARLIVRNINYKAKEEDLREYFGKWGQVEEVNLLKKPDGKLVGCAFIQYATINQAQKAIFRGNNQTFMERNLLIEKALRKSDYVAKKEQQKHDQVEPKVKKAKTELKNDSEDEDEKKQVLKNERGNASSGDSSADETDTEKEDIKSEKSAGYPDQDTCDDKEIQTDDKKSVLQNGKIKPIKNDVEEGCTIFLKNVPMDANEQDLRKACRQYGPMYYAIINREPISGHSKGTAFVKFKAKESADMCLQAGSELQIMDEILEVFPALSRNEIIDQMKARENAMKDGKKDSRNLYLVREGLIMAGSKAAEGVSASDMNKRHKLEQIKAQVLKNLNRFVSRNRLSIHNLPLNYDNEKLRDMVIKYTDLKPHECRVMRENRITAEHPKGKSKGFGFMSFATHQNALMALRKLNNNPSIFGSQHRPIVAFSIEDRAVEKMKEKRQLKSKISNPTYQKKLSKSKENKKQRKLLNPPESKTTKPASSILSNHLTDNKYKLKKQIKKLEESRAKKAATDKTQKTDSVENLQDNFVGTPAHAGGTQKTLRSFKKIQEQSQVHMKRVKEQKKRIKQKHIRQAHANEKKNDIKPKKGKPKMQKDDLQPLVNKYKKLLDRGRTDHIDAITKTDSNTEQRIKWYKE